MNQTLEAIDQWYVRCLKGEAVPEETLDILSLWMVGDVASRSGVESILVEQPKRLVTRVSNAARKFGFAEVQKLWDAATNGMELTESFTFEDVKFRCETSAAELQRHLVFHPISDRLLEIVRSDSSLMGT